MRSTLKAILKFVTPAGSGPRLRRMLNDVLEDLRGVLSRARLIFTRREQFKINITRRDRRVIFVSETPMQREAKLAYGLKRAGWDVIQLYRIKNALADFSSMAETRQFHSSWEAVELAHRAECRVFHNFSWIGDQTAVLLTDNKPGRVVFDFYDYVFSMADGVPEMARSRQAQVTRQAYCIERADALCCRDMQLQYRRKQTRLGRGKPVILFPEYCWNNQPLPEPRGDGEVRLVQIGTMGMETIGEEDVGSYRVFERLVEAGCHLDIYLHPYFPLPGTSAFEMLFREYLALQASTSRVHFHPPVLPRQVVEEIARYDFGASVNNGLTFDIPWSQNNIARLPFCGSSRLFDYIDAGLGLILHRQLKFMCRIFRPYGAVFDATELIGEDDLKMALGKKPGAELIARARAELSIERNIGRLTAFYEKLI